MPRKKTIIFSMIFCCSLIFSFVGCTKVPYTTYVAMSNKQKDITIYATLMALNGRGYLIETASIDEGFVATKKRAHQSGSFWWVINCSIQSEGDVLVSIDSNLITGEKMHKRARNWIFVIKNDIEKILLSTSESEIRESGKAILKGEALEDVSETEDPFEWEDDEEFMIEEDMVNEDELD